MAGKTATPRAPRAPKPAAPAVVETPAADVVETFAERVAAIKSDNARVRDVFGTIIVRGADAYWTARSGGMIGADGDYATEGALFVDAMGFAKSQGSTLKRLGATIHAHGYALDSAEVRVVRDRGGMAWASFLTPKSGDVPALTEAQRVSLANVARYNDANTFVASVALDVASGKVTLDDAGKPVAVIAATREAQPNDGTGTGGDADETARQSAENAPKGIADILATANHVTRLILVENDAETLDMIAEMIGDAITSRLAFLAERAANDADADAENVPA